jgi:hypothetical protein
MKSGEVIVVVESVKEVVKFYTEKLGFDLINLKTEEDDRGAYIVTGAHVRKGKCVLYFKTAGYDELADFSIIKRCINRCIGIEIEFKKGIEKYYARCIKKNVPMHNPLKKDLSSSSQSFSVKDPCGLTLTFVQERFQERLSQEFLGITCKKEDLTQITQQNALIDQMIGKMKKLGILRRAAKKYARILIKQHLK